MTNLHTIDHVAERLHMSGKWVRRFVKRHPYYKLAGRRMLFSDADIERLIGELPCPSNCSVARAPKAKSTRSAGRSSENAYSRLQELLTSKPQRQRLPR